MKNRIFGAALMVACALGISALAWAQLAAPDVINLIWRDSADNVAGYVDTTYTGHAGGSNATRDTSVSFSLPNQWYGRVSPTVADSSLWMRVNIFPKSSSAIPVAADSLYAYVETLTDGGTWSTITNMTEILAVENGTSNVFTFPISWGRRAMEVQGRQTFRVILRGDHAGQYQGTVNFYKHN